VRQGNKRTTQVAEARAARWTPRASRSIPLNAATIEQTRQIEETLKRINDLSVEIQKDINQIIVAMQFQDITRQKLERCTSPRSAPRRIAVAAVARDPGAAAARPLSRGARLFAERLQADVGREGVETAAQLDAAGDATPARWKSHRNQEGGDLLTTSAGPSKEHR
jgi:hypothetical protein